ncbi:glycine oxidase ThiO [Solemya velesiana gill symbiont]|uniref:Glycine oxidase ThiO n=1 Tax=Solemya velesiana gill symbiont TaxID=1918948 RepID=A0A1T2KRY3_9GAMM|nr:glycine oxidase ThiO [Solemya velesiana gill symbiont]OOZ35624.1 glycine oxidase ThiO [Solemya velesiana gill symbiont]
MHQILIIGGGAIGMLTARELSMAGYRVAIFDRLKTGRESSWAGGGIISPLYPWRYADSVTALACWGQEHYRELAEQLSLDTGIDPEWTQSGLLVLSPEEEETARQWAARSGSRIEILDREGIASREPAIDNTPDSGIWLPDVAQVRNPRLVKALHKDLAQRGVEIHEETTVERLLIENGRICGIETDEGTYRSDKVLICAGAWTKQLLGELGTTMEITPVRGQMILFKAEPGVINRITLENDRYIIPRRDGHILFGSTLEHEGFDKRTTEEAGEELYRIATSRLPALKSYSIEKQWAGLRPGSPAGIPYIGPHPDVAGLFVNSGHFRNGVVLGPASSRLITDIMLEREPILPPAPYALNAPREEIDA